MVWGLVFSYLEGKRSTEFTGAVLSISFIFSSGVVKSIGKGLLIHANVNTFWMPFIAGAFFVLSLILFTWLLNQIPPPSENDILLQNVRKPMTAEYRMNAVKSFQPGLVTIVFTYSLLTIIRDFRDNFSNELFNEMGFGNDPAIFSSSEIPISLILLLCISLLVLVKSNIISCHVIIFLGYSIALTSNWLFHLLWISPFYWMFLVEVGLYMSYVPFNCLYFERMIASYKVNGNFGFYMYIAESFG